jgi:redox-sensitive bicupin YhaK (pirin superfamily)
MSGGLFHGFQLWVNLPAEKKWSQPKYQDLRASEVALLSSSDGGALLRVIAGEIDGHQGPGSTQTPMTMVHVTLQPGAQLRLPWNPNYNALVYTLNGKGSVGDEKRPVEMGQLAVLNEGGTIVVSADQSQESRSPQMDVLILGGAPINESIAWLGPFVMNTKTEVLKAFEDFQKGVLGSIPADYVKGKRPIIRSGDGHKLGGDIRGVHGTPTTVEESD